MSFNIQTTQEKDGSWIVEISELPDLTVYGKTLEEAVLSIQARTLRVLADRLEQGEAIPEVDRLFSITT